MDFDLGSGLVQAAAIVLGLLQSAPTPSAPVSSNPASQVIEIVKLVLFALPGYLVAVRQAKKEQKSAETVERDRLAAGFESMSVQAREQLTKAYEDAVREREARREAEECQRKAEEGLKAAEGRVRELEVELAKVRGQVQAQVAGQAQVPQAPQAPQASGVSD